MANNIIIISFLILFCSSLVYAQNELPNINYMLLGFDPFIGQPTLSALKYPVFASFDYSNNQTVDIESETFLVPNILTCIDYPSSTEKSITQIYTSELLLQQSVYASYSHGFDPWYSLGMFSSSEQSEYFHQVRKESASYTATTNLEYTVYKVWYDGKNTLTKAFEEVLNELPDFFNSSTCKYFKNLFQTYGTHFISQAIFGGSVLAQTTFSISLLQSLTIEEIHADIETQFLLSTQETLSYYQEQQLEQLNAMYSSVFVLVGGNPAAYNVSQYEQWEQTVLSDPVLVRFELQNFTRLLNPNDTNKISALNNAMTSYFYSWYIGWENINTAPYDIFDFWINYAQVNAEIYFFAGYNNYKYNLIENLWYDVPRGPYDSMLAFSCAAVNTNIYCFGGINFDGEYSSAANIFDTKTSEWNSLPNLPVPLQSAKAVAVGNNIYIFGAVESFGYNHCDDWWNPASNIIYDILSQTYTTAANLPVCLVGYNAAVAVNNTIYYFGPINCQMYCYDVSEPGSSSCYCSNVGTNGLWAYDIDTNVWTQLADMPATLENFAVFELDGSIYVVGGVGSGYVSASIYAYDISENTWSIITTSSHNTQMMGIAVTMEKLLYFFGGNYLQQYYEPNTVQTTALEKFC